VNNALPTSADIIQHYKRVFDGATLKEEVQNIFNLFITTVLPIIHMASCAKHNWQPFGFESGVPPIYSSYITSSDEAFTLFLLKHYRIPPMPKGEKQKQPKSPLIKKQKHAQHDENKEDDENKESTSQINKVDDIVKPEEKDLAKGKRNYKKKVNIKKGEQDYQKWMHCLKMIKNTGGKEGVLKMDKTLSAMIIEYHKNFVNQGIDITNVGGRSQ